jgi:hypothetical protein
VSNRLHFVGLDQFKAEFAKLPDTITIDAAPIVEAHVEAAHAAIAAGYPFRAASVRDALTTRVERIGLRIAAEVRNDHPLAWLMEHGSALRHTALGADRGALRPVHNFIPVANEWARRQYAALADLLRQHGLTVTGSMDEGDIIR